MAEEDCASPPKRPMFAELSADDEQQEATVIESLCLNCHEQGTTRLMLTRIPFFREVIVSSFSCDHCAYSDSEVQFGGSIQVKGQRLTLTIQSKADLNRQLVKSDWASLSIPCLDLEQPPAKRGEVTTVEGLLRHIVTGIEQFQPVRRATEPDTAAKLDAFVARLEKLHDVAEPFTIIVDDPSGNSAIENPHLPAPDPALAETHYPRTRQLDLELGFAAEEDDDAALNTDTIMTSNDADTDAFDAQGEVVGFAGNCPACNSPCQINMKVVDIPYFKQVVLMASACDRCNYREAEVKSGAAIEDKGRRITLRVTRTEDLKRDLLKSDTCGVCVPELGLELEEGTLGGKFTTVEGLLLNICDQLAGKNSFVGGDSASDGTRAKLDAFTQRVDAMRRGDELGYTLVLDDPGGNSYLENPHAPADDPEMSVVDYERTFDQNELLGLNDMKTENYETS